MYKFYVISGYFYDNIFGISGFFSWICSGKKVSLHIGF